MRSNQKNAALTRHWPTAASIIVVLIAWQILADLFGKGGLLLPGPLQVTATLVDDRVIIAKSLGVTLSTAGLGLIIGAVLAAGLAAPTVLLPLSRRPMVRQMTIFYCLPLVTIAPLLYLVASGRTPQVVMAASSVVFPIFISLVQGLTTPHVQWKNVVDSLGGGRWMYFLKVQVPGATREFFTAARVAGPAAILGATLAEYFGGTAGIGVVMINSLAQLNAPRAFGLGIVITLVASAVFLIVGAIGKAFFPWTKEMTSDH